MNNSSPNPNKTIEQAIDEQLAAEPTLPGWGGLVGMADPSIDIAEFITEEQQLEIFGCLADED